MVTRGVAYPEDISARIRDRKGRIFFSAILLSQVTECFAEQ
jgi:hypothetical protein